MKYKAQHNSHKNDCNVTVFQKFRQFYHFVPQILLWWRNLWITKSPLCTPAGTCFRLNTLELCITNQAETPQQHLTARSETADARLSWGVQVSHFITDLTKIQANSVINALVPTNTSIACWWIEFPTFFSGKRRQFCCQMDSAVYF